MKKIVEYVEPRKPKESLQALIPADLRDALRAQLKRDRVSYAAWLRAAIRRYLDESGEEGGKKNGSRVA